MASSVVSLFAGLCDGVFLIAPVPPLSAADLSSAAKLVFDRDLVDSSGGGVQSAKEEGAITGFSPLLRFVFNFIGGGGGGILAGGEGFYDKNTEYY